MDSSTFKRWLKEMQKAKLASSDAECGRLLGVSRNTILSYKAQGTSITVALACRALLHRMEPYS